MPLDPSTLKFYFCENLMGQTSSHSLQNIQLSISTLIIKEFIYSSGVKIACKGHFSIHFKQSLHFSWSISLFTMSIASHSHKPQLLHLSFKITGVFGLGISFFIIGIEQNNMQIPHFVHSSASMVNLSFIIALFGQTSTQTPQTEHIVSLKSNIFIALVGQTSTHKPQPIHSSSWIGLVFEGSLNSLFDKKMFLIYAFISPTPLNSL